MQRIFEPGSGNERSGLILDIFRFQYENCPVYREFTDRMGIQPGRVSDIRQIPFLPIQFFKTHDVVTGNALPGKEELLFMSSGTSGTERSRHRVTDAGVYRTSFRRCFELFYGAASDYCLLALLPSYLEQKNSSLVYMMADLIQKSGHAHSGFYMNNTGELLQRLRSPKGRKVLLMGVSYALLDLAEKISAADKECFRDCIIMETGGMKGRRQELIREELHQRLCAAFGVNEIHSEYGMTELLSQAYSMGKGLFRCPPWMKVLIRDTDDPFRLLGTGRTGGINIIDLANIHSCSFIATQDLGRLNDEGSFEVLGRFDHSDIRGCNLLADS